MTWYAVYDLATGHLESTGTVVASDAELAAQGRGKKEFAFEIQVHTKQWNEGTLDFDDVVPPKAKITPREFWARFTPSERDDIFEASRFGSPAVKKALHAFVEYVKLDDAVDVEDSYIVNRVNRIETAGLIGVGRATEILA